MCCVGFLSASSMRVYAFESEDNFYPYTPSYPYLNVYQNDWNTYVNYYNPSLSGGKFHFDNPYLENVIGIIFQQNQSGQAGEQWTFPFQPEVYDYYFLGTLTAYNTDKDASTFKPTNIRLVYRDYDNMTNKNYSLSGLNVYDIDTGNYNGFGFYTKVSFESSDNTGISQVIMSSDKDGLGNKPANLIFEAGVLAIEKGTDEVAVMSQILDKLSEMESSITGSIDAAGDKVADAIENQYAMSDTEDFGVGQIADQVEENLGVLSFGADTLNNFLGLFQASNAGSTVLTFPSFTIDVQGESYQVWNDIQFDLTFLEENFGILITAVRTVTVLCVWLAVLGYMVKAYEHLVNNKG